MQVLDIPLILIVLMVRFDWLEKQQQQVADLRSATIMPGEPFATISGENLIVMWHAVSLDSIPMVSYAIAIVIFLASFCCFL